MTVPVDAHAFHDAVLQHFGEHLGVESARLVTLGDRCVERITVVVAVDGRRFGKRCTNDLCSVSRSVKGVMRPSPNVQSMSVELR